MRFSRPIVSVHLWLTLTTAASIPTLAATARAESSEPPAATLVERAVRAQSEERFTEAVDNYARAYQISGDPHLLFQIGQCQRAAGRDTEALRTLHNYLRRDPRGPYRDRAEKQIHELESSAGSGRGVRDAAVPLPPAPAVVLPAPSAPPAPTSPPAPASPPAPVSPPALTSSPAASPPALTSLSTPAQPRPDLGPVPTVDLRAAPAAATSATDLPVPRWIPWSLTAATVALGGVAIWSGVSANHQFDQLQQSCGRTPQGCDAAAVDDLRARARRTNILWAATGVAAIGAGVTIYVNTSAAGVSGLWKY